MGYYSDKAHKRTPEHRRGKKRKRFSRIATLLVVLGGMCLALGGLVALIGLLKGTEKMTMLGLVYVVVGVVLLILRAFMMLGKDRRRKRKRGGRSGRMRKFNPVPPVGGDRDGMALVVVLILLVVLTAIMMHALVLSRKSVEFEHARVGVVQLRAAAADAAYAAMQALADDEDLAVDHLKEPWAQLREEDRPDGLFTLVKITDLQSRFDVNNLVLDPTSASLESASTEALENLMNLCGVFETAGKMNALRDWIDADEVGLRESSFYAEQDPPYATADTWLRSLNELLLVDEFGPELFVRQEVYEIRSFHGALLDTLCVIPVPRAKPIPVNLNTAPRKVLLGLVGVEDETLVDQILLVRGSKRQIQLGDLGKLVDDAEKLAALKPFVSVKSSYFLVEARAYQQEQSQTLQAMVMRSEAGEVRIMKWLM